MELSEIAEESARGSFSLMLGTAASTVIGALAVILIARLLGPAGYGMYTLAWVLPTLFVSVADLGVTPALVRYGASLRSQNRYEKLASMIGSGLLFELVVGSAGLLLVFGFSGRLAAFVLQRQELGQLVALTSVTILFQGIFSLSYGISVGLNRMEQSAGLTVLRDGVRVILSPLLIVVGFGVAGAIAGQVLAWVFAGFVSVWLLVAHRRVLRNTPGEIEAKHGFRGDMQTMMSYGLPLFFGSMLAVLLTQYMNIVLAFFSSNVEIGNFSAGVNFGALIEIVTVPLATSLFPAFSKLDFQTRHDELKRMFELSVRYTTLLILPMVFAVAALSKDLIRVVYGAAYAYASTYLSLYVGIFTLAGLGYYVIGNFLSGVGKTRETLKIGAVQLAVFLPAAPIMAWLYSIPGVIVALVLSTLVSTGFGLTLATRKYGMQIDLKGSLATLAAAVASSLPVLLVSYYSPLPALGNVIAGGVIYVVAYLTFAPIFRAVTKPDLQIVSPILSRINMLRSAVKLVLAYETLLVTALEPKGGETSETGPA